MRNIDKPVMVFNRSIEEINRERERLISGHRKYRT